MGATALVGCQWGDEGKGKIVDILSAHVDAVARYQGGANAGHTVVIGETKHVLHLLPTGILRKDVLCLLGTGMVLDLDALFEELAALAPHGFLPSDRLFVSPGAHVVVPYHRAVEKHRESSSAFPIGTTLRGIGPAYETAAARFGLRVGDLYAPDRLAARVASLEQWAASAGCGASELPSAEAVMSRLRSQAERLRPYVRDVRAIARDLLGDGKELLFEGAQGVLLDKDHGTYPFVTSSSTGAGGAAVGFGVPPSVVSRVVGVCKAYTTRVGEGPFPTEFEPGPEADAFRKMAGEFGATTGRPRRCGWLDGPLLRYAAEVNGLTALVITKLDVLDGRPELRIATSYERSAGASGADLPCDWLGSLQSYEPVYETFPGWSEPTAGTLEWGRLPDTARAYLTRVEEIAGVPIAMVSTGNRRDQVIVRRPDLLPRMGAAALSR